MPHKKGQSFTRYSEEVKQEAVRLLLSPEFEFVLIKPSDASSIWHQHLELIFVLQGTGCLHCGEGAASYAIREGDIFAVNSFQIRSIALDQSALALSLLISPTFITSVCPEITRPVVNCKSFLFSKDRQQPFDLLRRGFANAFRAQYKNESQLSIHLRGKLVGLLDDLFQHFLVDGPAIEEQNSANEHLRAATDYIHQHYQGSITLADLAKHTFLSSSYISRIFHKFLGVTFKAYLSQVRLIHATVLLGSEATITEIAYNTGFSSAHAFIEAYKQYRGLTPGQYRRNIKEQPRIEKAVNPTETVDGFSTAFSSLMRYANVAYEEITYQPVDTTEITVDTKKTIKPLQHHWKRLMNAGYGKDLLNGSVQTQIAKLQREIGFQYIRCKGILDDDMMLFTTDVNGNPNYNFVYLDTVVDFILSTGAMPMLEFSYMPSILAQNKPSVVRRPSIISAPRDIDQWGDLITAIVQHLMQRYGQKSLRRWLFSPWCAPEFSGLGLFTWEEYTQIYLASYRAIKSVCSDIIICGPGNGIDSLEANRWFLDMCKSELCMPDILSFRAFMSIVPGTEKGGLDLNRTNDALDLAVSGDEQYLASALQAIRGVVKEQGLDLPVMLEEWSNNIWQRDLCNDTSYKSTYIFKAILENYDSYHAMGYFSASDQMDEIAPAAELFHGGFGLFTRNGLPKSAFRAMELLNRIGDELVASGQGYFMTKKDGELQIYLYNYTHYDMLYRYRHTTHLTKTERYNVFNEKRPQSFHIRLDGLEEGKHTLRRYHIGPGGGSTFDAWIRMGAPEQLNQEEEHLLDHQSHPLYSRETVHSDGSITLHAHLQPHEVQLITITG
ncbi:GH39 family glycosyl hydrolase [Paenibacillus terrigena]|uniref:GH39 family glycosyl hydrolase n=1 Tax=Paenibacillus terrigena TaxID=369333 RepID=UPI00037ED8E7|nr:helix-turn-helix domain-containing protein [Paenibacillus terrigena]